VPETVEAPETVDLPVVVDEPVPEEEPEYESYTIRGGDTISEIARKYKVSMDEILKLNGITDVRKIQIGQVLKIPK
jgi:LysM repeat protein